MSDTQTPNFGFEIPDIGADSDAWGSLLNDNWLSIDTLLATFMPLSGGSFTGGVTFDTTATFTGIATFTVPPISAVAPTTDTQVPNKLYVDGEIVAAISAISFPVDTVFGRTGTVIAVDGDYDAFYLNLGGGTLTGQLTLPGGGTGLEAATVDEVDLKAPLANPALTGVPTAPTAASDTDDDQLATTKFCKSGSSFASQLLHIRDEKSSGTNGGTFTSGAWQTRDLNTILTNEIGATLASDEFTLLAGEYYIKARAPARGDVDLHKARLRQISGTPETMLVGSNSRATGGEMTDSWVTGRFTVSGTETFELQHRSAQTNADDGFGNASSFDSDVEVYSDVEIWKVG